MSWLFRGAAVAVIVVAFDESPALFPAAIVAIGFLALDAGWTVYRAISCWRRPYDGRPANSDERQLFSSA